MENRFENYTFRCSSLGKIISKSGKFTDGIKTYLEELFVEEIYGVKKEAFGKSIDKGVFCEEDGITMLGETLLKGQLVLKNKERRMNDFINGECDVFKNGVIYDIKNALDLFTFAKSSLTWDYEWQLKGYSWLWNSNKAVLYYCLNNMPEAMLEEQKMQMFYRNRWRYSTMESEDYIRDCEKLEEIHNYDRMEIFERFKFWELNVNDNDIERIKSSVLEA